MRSTSAASLAFVLFVGLAPGAYAHSDAMSKPIATSKTSEPTMTPNSDKVLPISSYDLNNPDDVKAFWEQNGRNGK